jgi:urease accessory protein
MKEADREVISPRLSHSRVQASLALDFKRDQSSGHTVLGASLQEPPLRVVRAFPLDDGSALAHLHNVSGGLLGGDRLALCVRVGVGASVQLTTTGATRIYRQPANAPATTQSTEIDVAENALLEYLPDPLIPFAGAYFSQQTTIRLAQGAGLFCWEIVAPGREARGEVFAYKRVEMKSDLSAAGRRIGAERIRLEPRDRELGSLARLGPYRYWATFYVCRVGPEPGVWLAAEKELRKVARELSQPARAVWGISTLVAHGLVVRSLACHGRDVIAGLHTLWCAAKLLLFGREAVPPRKVN